MYPLAKFPTEYSGATSDARVKFLDLSNQEARDLFDAIPDTMEPLILALDEAQGDASTREKPHYLILRINAG